MDLHIKDRLLIPSIFPERGSFMDYNPKKVNSSENSYFRPGQERV